MAHRSRTAATAAVVLVALLAGCSEQYQGDLGIDTYVKTYTRPHAGGPASAPGAILRGDQCPLLADMDKPLGQDGSGQSPAPPITPARKPKPPHWSVRRGPAYKDDWLRSLGRDAKEMPFTLWDDTKATFTDRWALVGLGAAGALGILAHEAGDDRVADHYTKHGSQLNKFWDNVGDAAGHPGLHFAVAGTMYFGSLGSGNTKDYETSKNLLNGLVINGLTTFALKGIVGTESPNGDSLGWPSGHTSSSFCLATVLHEAYGPYVGVPLFVLAGYVGYERIDARNHDFSDVISGALIGIAIGHAVSKHHEAKIFGFDVIPYADPSTGRWRALSKQF